MWCGTPDRRSGRGTARGRSRVAARHFTANNLWHAPRFGDHDLTWDTLATRLVVGLADLAWHAVRNLTSTALFDVRARGVRDLLRAGLAGVAAGRVRDLTANALGLVGARGVRNAFGALLTGVRASRVRDLTRAGFAAVRASRVRDLLGRRDGHATANRVRNLLVADFCFVAGAGDGLHARLWAPDFFAAGTTWALNTDGLAAAGNVAAAA